MLAFCERILVGASNIDRDSLAADAIRYDAALRHLELIGEAATHVADELRAQAPNIPWRQLIATRNRLIHAHLGIDTDTLCSIVNDDVPALRQERPGLLNT